MRVGGKAGEVVRRAALPKRPARCPAPLARVHAQAGRIGHAPRLAPQADDAEDRVEMETKEHAETKGQLEESRSEQEKENQRLVGLLGSSRRKHKEELDAATAEHRVLVGASLPPRAGWPRTLAPTLCSHRCHAPRTMPPACAPRPSCPASGRVPPDGLTVSACVVVASVQTEQLRVLRMEVEVARSKTSDSETMERRLKALDAQRQEQLEEIKHTDLTIIKQVKLEKDRQLKKVVRARSCATAPLPPLARPCPSARQYRRHRIAALPARGAAADRCRARLGRGMPRRTRRHTRRLPFAAQLIPRATPCACAAARCRAACWRRSAAGSTRSPRSCARCAAHPRAVLCYVLPALCSCMARPGLRGCCVLRCASRVSASLD